MASTSLSLDSQEVADALSDHKALVSEFAIRNQNNLRYDDIFNMIWEYSGDLDGIDTVQTSVDASIRNRILGMRRLLDGTDLHVDASTTDPDFKKDDLENALKSWFKVSDKLSKKRTLSDMALATLLHGEVQVGLSSTKAMLESVAENRKAAAKRVADRTPYLITTWHPNQGRYRFDELGMYVFSHETKITWGQVQSMLGQYLDADQMAKKKQDEVTVVKYWNLDVFVIFVDDKAIHAVTRDGQPIPVEVTLVDGSQLFTKVEDQRQSVMYAVDKADYFNQQSLLNTLEASIVFALGIAPMYEHQLPPGDENRQVDVDHSVIGGVVNLLPGETYKPINNRGLIDPSVVELHRRNSMAIEESTIYNTALGAPVESNIAFSTVSLLAQQGRLPLSGPQLALGTCIGNLMELGLTLLKSEGRKLKSKQYQIEPKSLPEDLDIEVRIDIKLPQDKLQLANIAHLLKGDNLADTEWIQSNVLNITDTTKMSKAIVQDKIIVALTDLKIQGLVTQMQQGSQPPAPGAPQGMPGQPAPMGGPGVSGMPPQAPDLAQMEQLGMNNTGTPPEGLLGPAAQGGMLPSQGMGVVPGGA
jgi:hypothetical protein